MDAAFWPVVVIGAFFVWVIYVAVDLEVPAFLAKWYREPGNSVRAMTWVGSLFIVLITFASSEEGVLGSLRTDAITIAVTVIVIEELGRYRAALEEKERIIRQMASHSNDFALDAVKQVRENGWHEDGSLWGKDLAGANLQGADLHLCNLRGVKLADANLQKVKLAGTSLQEASFRWANLQGADLMFANLQRADLMFANLQEANVQGINLQEAKLAISTLEEANFEYASLQKANLDSSVLRKANLADANLLEADLTNADLRETKYSAGTRWPEGFDPKAAGAILVHWDEKKRDWSPVRDESAE